MVKRTHPKYVYAMGRNGYLYFRHDGVSHRMPDDASSAEFAQEYARLRKGHHTPKAKQSVKKLIASYMQSDKWDRLAANTKKSYFISFKYIEEKIGKFDPATIKASHVYAMRDALKATPTTARHRVTALSCLLQHAVKIGWVEVNPIQRFEHLKSKRPARQPWPQDMIDAARATADTDTLLLFEMLLGTGQRISDVLAMQWGRIEDGGIWVKQIKTKTTIYVPFTSRLASILAATPRRGLTIVTLSDGRPMGYSVAWKRIRLLRKAIGANSYDIHALRHAAASEIAAIPGMTSEHVMAITGHSSMNMVRLYAGKATQKARAQEAQKERK